jgi:hypothetical protein
MMGLTDQEIALLRRLARSGEEEQELVRAFFADTLAGGPLWLVPILLQFVAGEAGLADLKISLTTAGTIDPNGGPWGG